MLNTANFYFVNINYPAQNHNFDINIRHIKMKIYTKTGDKGLTSLIGGTRVAKHHIRIESYGTVDELNSYIGLISDQDITAHDKAILKHIQDRLFTIGSSLAADPEKSRMVLI